MGSRSGTFVVVTDPKVGKPVLVLRRDPETDERSGERRQKEERG
jgi:hypothetical protein